MDFFPYPGEQQFLGYIRANYLNLFPKLKVDGLCVHVAAKMTSHTLRIFLYQRFGIDVLTFEQHSVSQLT